MNFFRLATISVFSIFLSALFFSCDKIDEPYMVEHDDSSGNGDNSANDTIIRNFILEEYTGHRCPNCPVASETAKQLKSYYNDRLIIISIHSGHFAMPIGGDFAYDFRTSEGDQLHSYFGVSGLPIGMVSRAEYESSVLLPHGSWGSAMKELEKPEAKFAILPEVTANSNNSAFTLNAKIRAIKELSSEYYLVALITESGIVKPQSTNNPDFPDGIDYEYEHNYVLRKAITNIWGEEIEDSYLVSLEQFEKSFEFQLNEEWEAANCHVVVYIMDGQTLEIMQAAKTNIL